MEVDDDGNREIVTPAETGENSGSAGGGGVGNGKGDGKDDGKGKGKGKEKKGLTPQVAQVDVPAKKKKGGKKDPNEGKPDETRQLLNLEICSIQLSELIPAHRFKKNSPWLSVLYGAGSSGKRWTAPYQDADEGDRAEFLGLAWSFILQRDTRHRDDLIVIVNSEDIIIGRYILGRAEFVNVPNTASGYFKVSGDIINGLGKAGELKIVFKKQVAEPPKAPRFVENITAESALNTLLPHHARAYIRVISIACVDLRSMSILEANSPHIVLTCGQGWRKTTDVSVGSGLSAKWNRLPWKLVMEKFNPLVLNVMTGDVLIGRISMTLDELVVLPENEQGFIEIIRPISEGVRVTGRVRVVMLVRGMSPHDTVETFAVATADAARREMQFGEDTQGHFSEVMYPPYGKSMDGPETAPRPKPSSYVISGQCPSPPFIMIVREIGVFDAKNVNPRRANSLSVNAVCGKWGCSTSEIANSGQNALWIDLQAQWKFTVELGCVLRFNVWSSPGHVYLGNVVLSAQDLVDIPVDPDGSMEIMTKIMDGDKSCGRLRVLGTYEWWREHVVVAEKIIAPVVHVPERAKKMVLDIDGEGVPQCELPVLAVVMSISAVDLKAVHGLIPNSPKAKIVCDRKMAQTKATLFGGRQGRWTGLNWPVPVNEGCVVNLYIYSGEVMIGWLEMQAHEIVRYPLDQYGLTVINLPLRDIDGLSTGRVQVMMQLNNVMVEDYDRLATKAKTNHYDLSPPGEKDIRLRDPYQPDPEMKEYLDNAASSNETGAGGRGASKPQTAFFSLDETRKTNTGIMLKVEVMEIDVTDLKPMHMLEKNSPVVSAACGKFAGTTKTQLRAGKDAFWDKLGWNFLMSDEISLQFVVGSGQKTVGIVNILPPIFIAGRADQRGIKRVTLPIYDANNRMAGKIKVTYTLGVIREEGYISRPQMDNRHVDEVTIPFNAKIGRVVATGLASVHTFGPNKPKFRVQSDDWSKLSYLYQPHQTVGGGAEELDSSDALWPSIGWSVPVLNDDLPLFFSVVSGKELIGSASVMPNVLLEIPKTKDGITEYVATLYNMQGKATGRLQVFLRCLASGVTDASADMDYDDPALQEAMMRLESSLVEDDDDGGQGDLGPGLDGSSTSLTLGMSSKGSKILPSLASKARNVPSTFDPASIFSPQNANGRYDSSPLATATPTGSDAVSVKVPSFFSVTITGVAVINLRSAHILSKNSPLVYLHCEEHEFHSDVRPGAGKMATWEGLAWYFFVENRHTIRLEMHSGEVIIGVIEWTAHDLFKNSKGRPGTAKLFAEMKTGLRFDGKIKLSYVINGKKPETPRLPDIVLVSERGAHGEELDEGASPEEKAGEGPTPRRAPPPPSYPPPTLQLDDANDDNDDNDDNDEVGGDVLPFTDESSIAQGMGMGFEQSSRDNPLLPESPHPNHLHSDLALLDTGSVFEDDDGR